MRTKTRTSWRAAPPAPPRGGGGGDAGRGDGGRLWWFLVLLHVALAIALLIGGYHLLRGALERPFPFAAAALSSAVCVIHAVRQPALGHEERYNQRPILGAIVGGVLGEALSYVTIGVPDGAPSGLVWTALGAGGIGGAVGVAVGVYAILLIATVVGSVALFRDWRQA
jgi:hypothetical protein